MSSESFIQNWNWQLPYIEQVKQILKSQAMHIVNIGRSPRGSVD